MTFHMKCVIKLCHRNSIMREVSLFFRECICVLLVQGTFFSHLELSFSSLYLLLDDTSSYEIHIFSYEIRMKVKQMKDVSGQV